MLFSPEAASLLRMKTGTDYPLAVVIGYGPDHKTATKLVVSIFKKPGQKDPTAMEKWFVENGDIRKDSGVMDATITFIKRHHAARTVTYDRVYGCPHEEGIDYPEGEVCPHCPFWANLDRDTLDPKSLELPLTPEQILAGLGCERDTQPLQSFAAVELHRKEMTEAFVQLLERVLNHPAAATAEETRSFTYALAFLTKWREPRVFPLVIRWLSLPDVLPFKFGGDAVSEWGPRMLATVCGGDLEPIKQLILNPEANEFCRGQAVEALAVLAAWNPAAEAEATEYLGWLAREGLEREPTAVWDNLLFACVDLEAVSVFADLRRAGSEDLVDPVMVETECSMIEKEPRGQQIVRFRASLKPFDDVVEETSWWECFSKDNDIWEEPPLAFARPPVPGLMEPIESTPYVPPPPLKPYVAPPKTGRNEPCPCGSGKKYKKCCGA